MSTTLEKIEQVFWLDHSERPPNLSQEEVENFVRLVRHLGYEAIAGIRPIDLRGASIGRLVAELGFGGRTILETGSMAGPYVWAGRQIHYDPDGVMLYRRIKDGNG